MLQQCSLSPLLLVSSRWDSDAEALYGMHAMCATALVQCYWWVDENLGPAEKQQLPCSGIISLAPLAPIMLNNNFKCCH